MPHQIYGAIHWNAGFLLKETENSFSEGLHSQSVASIFMSDLFSQTNITAYTAVTPENKQ